MSEAETIERPDTEVVTYIATMSAEAIEAESAKIVDGVYFGLPASIYHAVPRLSCSGIQRLCISPANFWRGSWLDPERPELDEDETKAQILGKAYHCARLEPDKFLERYAREIDKEDFAELAKANGAVWNGTEAGNQLAALGKTKKQAGESVEEQCKRLKDEGWGGVIWPLEQARFYADLEGRIPIPAKLFDDVVRDQDRLLGNKEVLALFEGGQSEVSIFWTDEHNIKMKARLDRLALARVVDFKSFENRMGKVLAQALADAVRFNRYYIQAPVYREAYEAIREGLEVKGEATEEQHKLVASIRLSPDEPAFWFVFQEKNGVPNLLARRFEFHALDPYRETEVDALVEEERQESVRKALSRKTQIYERALTEIRWAKRQFATYAQIYPPGVPWAPTDPMGTIGDLDFAPAWIEGKY